MFSIHQSLDSNEGEREKNEMRRLKQTIREQSRRGWRNECWIHWLLSEMFFVHLYTVCRAHCVHCHTVYVLYSTAIVSFYNSQSQFHSDSSLGRVFVDFM